jgi:hypothetical protein
MPLHLNRFGRSGTEYICNGRSAFWIRAGGCRYSRQLRTVGAIGMPNAGLQTTQHIEVPPVAGVLRLLVTGVAVAVSIDQCCVVGRVEVTH